MATSRYTSARSKTKPVEVSVTINEFQDIIGTGKPIANFTLKSDERDPRICIEGDVVHVKSPRTTIQFTIISSQGEKLNFIPAGITFVLISQRAKTDVDRLGLLNFPQRQRLVNGRSLSTTSNFIKGKKTVTYKFSLAIQRGSDGKIGIIDPAISHDSSDLRLH